MVAQKCSKHLAFLLMSESPCLPITPFHVLSSVPTCVLKSPSKTIDSAAVTFCETTPIFHLRKAGTVLCPLVCTPANAQ